jgi:hypothetical protein
MSSSGSDDGSDGNGRKFGVLEPIEYLLFDSLVHHLIEKGILTKNDALSVVETVAQVVRVYAQEESTAGAASTALATLRRTYSSFEAIRQTPRTVSADIENVVQLRPPLHGDHPQFPADD